MKKIIFYLLSISVFNLNAQSLVSIDTVITVDGTDANTIYDRVHSKLTENIRSQKQKEYVFKTEDKEQGIIKVTGTFLNNTDVFMGSGLTVKDISYEYQAFFKDGRMRLIVESFDHPYFGPAIDVDNYPEGSMPKMTSKKWYGKVYQEYLGNVKNAKNNILLNTISAINNKNVMEEEW